MVESPYWSVVIRDNPRIETSIKFKLITIGSLFLWELDSLVLVIFASDNIYGTVHTNFVSYEIHARVSFKI